MQETKKYVMRYNKWITQNYQSLTCRHWVLIWTKDNTHTWHNTQNLALRLCQVISLGRRITDSARSARRNASYLFLEATTRYEVSFLYTIFDRIEAGRHTCPEDFSIMTA